ncbi:MAG: heavy-metal-associated domain-containing protein [Leucobacter sp.]|nr:heavy-metal-associated domain-containing protein [Leucobacter sp.]
MHTTTYTVTGMTCANCEKHIREEVEQIAGVTGLEVSRETGKLVVTTEDSAVDDALVIAAVDEAGYSAVRA